MHLRDFKTLAYVSCLFLLVHGLSFLLCIPYAIYFGEPLKPFSLSALITLAGGTGFYFVSDKKMKETSLKVNILTVTLISILLILAGTLPYLISQTIPSFVDAVFESTSGFTTTGTSILQDVELLPKSILFWRSLSHWLGGAAAVVFVTIILPFLNIGGSWLFSISSLWQESPEPDFNYILKRIILVYILLTVAQTLLLCLGGINLFESLCYAFGTVSLGSFSPKNGSLEDYSPYIQYITGGFLLLSGTGYVFWFLLITGKFQKAWENEEVRFYGLIILSVSLIITWMLYFIADGDRSGTLRQSIFQLISFITNSGYATADYRCWPLPVLLVLFFFLITGACSGSVTGGIKLSRFLVAVKNLKLSFVTLISSTDEFTLRYNRKKIDKKTNLDVLAFIMIWGLVFVIAVVILSPMGTSLKRSAFYAASALSTFGHQFNLANLPDAGKALLSVLMLAGRLEIYPLLVLLSRSFYKNGTETRKKLS